MNSIFQHVDRRGFIRASAAIALLAVLIRITPAYAIDTIGQSENDAAPRADNPYDPGDIGKQHANIGGKHIQPQRAHVEAREKRLKEAQQKGPNEDRKAPSPTQVEHTLGIPAEEAPQ